MHYKDKVEMHAELTAKCGLITFSMPIKIIIEWFDRLK